MDQIELGNLYATDSKNKDCYMAAIAVRYWNILSKSIYMNNNAFTEDDAYDWYIEALLYTLESQQWNNPESNLYKDPKAIEKMLNTCFHSSKANWFQASNRYKRKLNHASYSLDALKEEYSDCFEPTSEDPGITDFSIKDFVYTAFMNKQYLFALMVDLIVNDLKLDVTYTDKSLITSLKKSIRSLTSNYAEVFATNYDIDIDKVEDSFKSIYNMSDDRLTKSLEGYIYKLRNIFRRDK